MEKVNWGMWVAFCLRLALQKLDDELGIVLELALRLFLRPGAWIGDCAAGLQLALEHMVLAKDRWTRWGEGEDGVRKLHTVHMTCAAPPHPSKIFSLWDFFRVETLLNGVFKHEAIDAAKDGVGGRGRRKVGTGSQSHDLHVLHLLGYSSSALRQIHLYL